MPVQIGARASNFSDPTGLMSDCHRRIEMFLNALRAVGDFAGRQLAEDERRTLERRCDISVRQHQNIMPTRRNLCFPVSALCPILRFGQL